MVDPSSSQQRFGGGDGIPNDHGGAKISRNDDNDDNDDDNPDIIITRDFDNDDDDDVSTTTTTLLLRQHHLTDDEFESFLHNELAKHPLVMEYPALFTMAPKIICKWRRRYRGNAPLWKRLFQKDRVLKEFIEAVPIIDAVHQLVTNNSDKKLKEGEKYTIIDLACGRGYLSMILSELLPPEKVEKIMLVDKAWPMHNVKPESHHISSMHIYGSSTISPVSMTDGEGDHDATSNEQDPHQRSPIPCTSYYNTWPIPLNISRVNLKKSREITNMERRLFAKTRGNDDDDDDAGSGCTGPIILLAVHLCGTLSLKAVELFNNNPNTVLFCLKPCCLPGIVHAKRDEIFHLGDHSFDSKLVCMSGKWNKNTWVGPCRSVTKTYFDRWAENLFLGIADGSTSSIDGNGKDATDAICTVAKVRKTIPIQLNGGYQNEFLFAERRRRQA